MIRFKLSKLGPGLLFAGAAIGVSHLVQSTRAGADFGWGLLWALVLTNLFKYPFFQAGPRYAIATGESLLEGYFKIGKGYLWVYFLLNFITMFTIQTAVTVVTAGLASQLFGFTDNIVVWSIALTFFCTLLLFIGRYQLLDGFIKIIMAIMALCSVAAFAFASFKTDAALSWTQIFPKGSELLFLVAFMGWMPAPLDISIWHSIWTLEKNKSKKKKIGLKESLFDFNVGYLGTFILAFCFLGLGALVMYQSGSSFSSNGTVFAGQLIGLYTTNFGQHLYWIIALAAFTTMLSTSITTLDASPRSMAQTYGLLFPKKKGLPYAFWLMFLASGTAIIFLFLLSEMYLLVQIATVLSFITSPLYAFLNYKLIFGSFLPKKAQPSGLNKRLAQLGLIFLFSFTLYYLLGLLT